MILQSRHQRATGDLATWRRDLAPCLRDWRRPLRARALVALLATLTLAATSGCRPDTDRAAARRAEAVLALETGLAFLERDQLGEAEAEFQRVIALAPREPAGHSNLGLTYLRGSRFDDAERHLDRARRLAPRSVEVALITARLYAVTRRPARARDLLEPLLRDEPNDPRVLFALAELEAEAPGDRNAGRQDELLERIVARAPTNLAVRLRLADAAVRRGDADRAVAQLEQIRRLPPEPPPEAPPLLEETIRLLRAGRLDEARAPFARYLRVMELTQPYQADLSAVQWVEGPRVGRPILTFEPRSIVEQLGSGLRPTRVELPRFSDVTAGSGIASQPRAPDGPPEPVALAFGEVNGTGTQHLFAGDRIYRVRRGYGLEDSERPALALDAPARLAGFADLTNNGWDDLFLVTASGQARLLRNRGNGELEDVTAAAGPLDGRDARHAAFVDLDHDGDLDLVLVGRGRRLVYRNNLDGTFTEAAGTMGLGGEGDARSIHFADVDGDGRVDVFITHTDRSDVLYRNLGGGRFEDVTALSGLVTRSGSGAAAVGDYGNDGHFDVFVSRVDGGEAALWRNRGDGTFARDHGSEAALRRLRGLTGTAAEFLDVDNDGWLDLVVAGVPAAPGGRSLFLLHNDGAGRFVDRSDLLPTGLGPITTLVPRDLDDDADLDLVVAGPGGVRLLQNDGGNARMASRVQLVALGAGSGKNNTFGVGARIELRAGQLYQTRVVTGRVTHFGLGSHLKADVLRIEWPNGVPQMVYLPGTDQDVLEVEQLKGSCPFLYTWDGARFRFVTDVMWRSALGMPVGFMGGEGMAYAPAAASDEYLRIPGDALAPRDGRYPLQITEELWETAYVDQVRLLALDHPDSVQVFVNERFVPPAPTALRLYPVVRPRPPRSAVDGRGRDLLPALREQDDRYAPHLVPLAYQGLVEPYEMVLDLGPEAGGPGTVLLLRGWIFPSDASINVALAQRSDLAPAAPSLEVRDGRGRWIPAIPDLGFPSGKNKTVVADLAGIFPTADRHVRIRTNMQISWDQAIVADAAPEGSVRVTRLEPVRAELWPRGYSRMYRKGGRYGPQWFDYDDVRQDHPWRPIQGAFTRHGDVLPLLDAADDQYVIMAPGDAMAVEFDARAPTTAAPGWTRTFLLHTVGWVKDADLNTAFGGTVEPLPFHGMRAYPYPADQAYPADSARRRYLREYNTRMVPATSALARP